MIHEILISLLTPTAKNLPLEEILCSEGMENFIHPCERKILEEIFKIVNQHREVQTFIHDYYGIHAKASSKPQDEERLSPGLYLQAFAGGIDIVLQEYIQELVRIEKNYLQNPNYTLMFLYHKISRYEPFFTYILKLIRGVSAQKHHGCAILQYLHQNKLHGDARLSEALETIQWHVNAVFFKQLTHWMLYGKLVDNYGEFFIQSVEARNYSASNDRCTSTGSGRCTTTTISEADSSSYAEIWRYEICHEYLPQYFPVSFSDKVLFIGQTVLMFKADFNKAKKKINLWNDSEGRDGISVSLWDGNECKFFKKIAKIQSEKVVNPSQLGGVVDEIKSFVTERLSQIAIDQADLVKQLHIIKDFFLIARGEFYLEFIKNISGINKAQVNETTTRELVKAFDTAANSMNLTDEIEKLSITIPKRNVESTDYTEFGFYQFIALQYKINWPLHLLFSPRVLDRYNELFRFLILIRKTQYELHNVWHLQRKLQYRIDRKVLLLRNQLMFLIDNLHFYIQVDVIESQFSLFMSSVVNSNDFEHIQKAHGIFQANLLNLCFLLPTEELSKTNLGENPVLCILHKIIHLSDAFYTLVTGEQGENLEDEYSRLETELETLVKLLLGLLVSFKAGSTQLSQLLLRLDYNHWFSNRAQMKVS